MKLNLSRDNTFDTNTEVFLIFTYVNFHILIFVLQSDPNSRMVCPLKIDLYCHNSTETALHAAIKGKHYDIVFALLKSGANVNMVIRAYHEMNEASIC